MTIKMLKVDSLEIAKEKLWEQIGQEESRTERIPIWDGCGRYLAEDMYTKENIPSFYRSTVDGYAVCSSDTQGVSESVPAFLTVIGEVLMGHEAKEEIHHGECVYVPTGGMVPAGADAMVMVEYCESFDESHIAVYQSVANGKNVVRPGEDMEEGSCYLKKGTCLRPQEIGALAAAGEAEVTVYEKWHVTIISTGDELAEPGSPLAPGQIYDVNTYALKTLAEKYGMVIQKLIVLKDVEEELVNTAKKALRDSDLILISGGSSQGKKDATASAIDQVASPGLLTHGLSIKPGKPTITGYDRETGTILVGLPGHPVAAMMIFQLLCVELMKTSFGEVCGKTTRAVMATNVAAAPGRMTCQLVRIEEQNGHLQAIPVFGKSGMISTLTQSDGYVMIDVNEEGLQKNQEVTVCLF